MYWLTVVEWSARLILFLLIFMSVWSIKIMIERRRYFASLIFPIEDLKNSIKSKKLKSSNSHFLSDFFSAAESLKTDARIEKVFEAQLAEKRKELEKSLPVLGTLGSTTPFIGLLGTIMGIIVSFGELSQGTGSTNAVMFSLAEALVLTAVGLLVAIPAVIAYNYFGRKVKMILIDAESLKDLYIAYRE